MKTFVELMRTYQHHHTKQITKITHFIGVPFILLALQIFLSWPTISLFTLENIKLSWIALLLLTVYYLLLDFSLALVTALVLVMLTYLAQTIAQHEFSFYAFSVASLLFVIGWIAQLIGHYFEGKKPAFMENILQALIAPIFLVAELVFALGFRKNLQKNMEA